MSVTGCESLAGLTTRMDEITGEYEMIREWDHLVPDYNDIFLPDLVSGFNKTATIYKSSDAWILEYSYPYWTTEYDRTVFRSIRLQQRVYYNQVLGKYLFEEPAESALRGSNFHPGVFGNISLSGETLHIGQYYWKKE